MRIGLYGIPTSGKTHILSKIDFMEVIVGSQLLRQYDPDFDNRDEVGREADRKAVAEIMLKKSEFIMDGHYAFGDEIAFTEAEGNMYDVYIYLYIAPSVLYQRMIASDKNRKYLQNNIEEWQKKEIRELRKYCQKHDKDFYVVDNPPENVFDDVDLIIDFIKDIKNGYSCRRFAEECVDDILKKCEGKKTFLFDGDKTLTLEDSSGKVLGYKTRLYDGNFYTGFQSWKQSREFQSYVCPQIAELPVRMNKKTVNKLTESSFILTSGHSEIWRYIADSMNVSFYCGYEMAAETKYFITKRLQEAGKYVVAYGDGMNDYFMLKQADEGFLVAKPDGTISKSLMDQEVGGLTIV